MEDQFRYPGPGGIPQGLGPGGHMGAMGGGPGGMHPGMGHPNMGPMGGMPPGMGGPMPPAAPPAKKKRKAKESNSGSQMNHTMYGGPRGSMMGPGDMYRPQGPYDGGHPGMMPPGMMGPRGHIRKIQYPLLLRMSVCPMVAMTLSCVLVV